MREHGADSRNTSLVSDTREDNGIECWPLRTLCFRILACNENGEMHYLFSSGSRLPSKSVATSRQMIQYGMSLEVEVSCETVTSDRIQIELQELHAFIYMQPRPLWAPML